MTTRPQFQLVREQPPRTTNQGIARAGCTQGAAFFIPTLSSTTTTEFISPSQLVREKTATTSTTNKQEMIRRTSSRVRKHLPFLAALLIVRSLKFFKSIVRATIIPCATTLPVWLTIPQIVTMSTLRGIVRAYVYFTAYGDRRHQSSGRQPFDYFYFWRRRGSFLF